MKAGFDDYGSWEPEPLLRPEMHVDAPDRFVNPVGFIDFRFKHMKAENGRNEIQRRCRIRTVRLK